MPLRRPLVAAAALAPLLASAGRAVASCVQVRNGAASVSSGCAPDRDGAAGSPGFGPFVAVADGHPQPVYVPVYVQVPVYVPVPAAAVPTPAPTAAGERRNRDQAGGDAADGTADLTVELDCEATPETTRITNDGDAPVTVRSIRSLVADDGEEPLARDDAIRPGRTVTYQSGEGAEGQFALDRELYEDGNRDEGVLLDTSGGEVEALCFAS